MPLVRSIPWILAAALVAAPALSELSAPLRDWAAGPVSFLFTDAERAAWAELSSDDEAERFRRLFWARRDPLPETPDNEALREFEGRVAAADERFGDDDRRGALTDRGRVLVVLGPPNRRANEDRAGFDSESGSAGTRPGGVGGGSTNFSESQQEIWTYEKDRLPKGVKANRLLVRFNSQRGYGVGVLDREGRALNALAVAVTERIVRPNLELADLPATATAADGALLSAWRATELTDARLRAALGGDLAAFAPSVAADLDVAVFQASDGRWEVVAQVMPRELQRAELALVGLVRDASGAERLAFRHAQPWRESKGRSYQSQALSLPPGSYDVRLGLAAAGGALVWAGGETVNVPATEEFWLSELVVSEEIAPLPQAQDVHEPWAWEGVRVVPQGGGRFAPGAAMWIYLHACNVQLGEGGKPALDVTATIAGPRRLNGPIAIEPSRAGPHCYVVATGIDLVPARYPAGRYEVELAVRDAHAGKTLASAGAFEIVGEAPAAPGSGGAR